jgi:hypothetical protein
MSNVKEKIDSKKLQKIISYLNMSSKKILEQRLQSELRKDIWRGLNQAGIVANQLKKLMKSGVNPNDQSNFEALRVKLQIILTELRSHCEYNLETQEMFNKLYQKVRRIVELSIDFFPGPQEAKQAKEEKDRIYEMRSNLWCSSGFSWDDLRKLPEFFLVLLLQFLTSPFPDVDIHQHHQNPECARIASLFLSNKVNLVSLMKKEMRDKNIDKDAMLVKNCMGRGSECATCLSYSLAHMIAHGLNRQESKGYKPNLNLKDGLLWAVIKGGYGIQNTKFILETFLKMCQNDPLQGSLYNWDALRNRRVSTMTIPNMLHAISNPESDFRQYLLGALTDYIDDSLKYKQRRKKFELRMLQSDATHKGLFEEWREWYSKKESNSAFKPYSFLDPNLVFEWNRF